MSLPPAMLGSFRDRFAGEIVLPGEPSYDAARRVWNGMVDRRPALVVRPDRTPDVIAAIRFARERDLRVAVRCGGHSIPGFSTCDGGIVIDLSRIRGAEVDPERRIARVKGGSLLGELDQEAQQCGLVCPVGVVAHTGVAGLTLGGGMGRLQRKLGLTLDNLLAVELVTANGEVVRASAEENPELFWGVRGAGPNFGIVTSFEFRLHPLDPAITHGIVLYPIERAAELAAAFRELVDHGPDELWASFGISRVTPADHLPPGMAGSLAAAVAVLHCGTEQESERDLAPLRAMAPPASDTIVRKPYLTAQRMYDDVMQWGHRFYMKSAFTSSFSDEVLQACVRQAEAAPEGGDCSFSVWACGRAIARVPEDAMAFSGRDAAFWIGAEAQWDDAALDEALRSWARAAADDLTPFATTGRYVNDVAESGESVVRSIYGPGKYERLVALKRAWDPENVFRLNQNVRPSP